MKQTGGIFVEMANGSKNVERISRFFESQRFRYSKNCRREREFVECERMKSAFDEIAVTLSSIRPCVYYLEFRKICM